jgi:uncharacterized protein (TIGR04255 family)
MADHAHPALPDFENPPVVETVLSVQFERISQMRAVHLGLFWLTVKDRFPDSEERSPLPSVFERFPGASSLGEVRFEALEFPELPRVWFQDRARTELIQIQKDRFTKNWRKASESAHYPRYERSIKPAFDRDFGAFMQFLDAEGLGPVRINQCEVTYVNHIVSGEGWEDPGKPEELFTFWNGVSGEFPGIPEDMSTHLRYPIVHETAGIVGRLHVDIQPALRATDARPMYVMNLTARGRLGEGTDFLDLGRKWIVNSFDRLTTPAMHRVWRRK